MNRSKDAIAVIIGYIGALAGCFGVIMINRYILMSLPLGMRMICMLISYWLIALVPIILMRIFGEKNEVLGFSKEKTGFQIAVGIISGLVIASLYYLVPYFIGFGSLVDNGSRYTKLWQFGFQLLYFIISVGAVEEIVFRGFLYYKLRNITGNEWVAMIASSVLFGFFHILNGNIIQVCLTTIIGFIFCMVRYKIKHCSMLSLILLHGVYDFMLDFYSSFLFI